MLVTAGMSSSMHNNATAKVYLQKPTRMEMLEYNREWTFNQTVSIPLAIYTGKLKKIDASFADK